MSEQESQGRPGRLLTVGEMRARAANEPQGWLIDGIIPEAGTILIAGASYVGKTRLVAAMMAAIASGRSFAGRAVKQGPVAILYLEHIETDLMEKLDAACKALGVRLDDLPVHQIDANKSQWRRGGSDLRDFVRTNLDDAKVVFAAVDSLRRISDYREADPSSTDEAASQLTDMTSDNRRLVAAIAHLNSGGGILGGDMFPAATDAKIICSSSGGILTLEGNWHRTPPATIKLRVVETPDGTFRRYDPFQPTPIIQQPSADARDQLLGVIASHPGWNKSQVIESVRGCRAAHTSAVLAELIADGLVIIAKGDKKAQRLYLPEPIRSVARDVA